MQFRLPKPLHGWCAFGGEVGVIVIGVLIALAAQQIVEAIDWREKVRVAQGTVDEELNDLLQQSYEATQLGQCATGWINAAEAAIKRRDPVALQTLYDAHSPFSPRNWRSTAWQTIMSTQVADHLDKRYLSRQAFLFSSFEDIRAIVPAMLESRSEVLASRLGFPDASAQRDGLVAADGCDLNWNFTRSLLKQLRSRPSLRQSYQ